jgi:two-component system, OmpR family, response regulator BaeR
MFSKPKVLLIEDDKGVAEVVTTCLRQANFDVLVLRRGDTAVTEVRLNCPDVILLDLILPGKDGITICREIRAFSAVPILMLTGKVEEDDRLIGLDAGADDYICKPFSPRELAARIKAVLRRKNPKSVEETLVAGPITIKPDSHTATIENTYLKLTPNEFELLKILVSQPGNVFERDDLISKICKGNPEGADRVIDAHIKNLRKKIAEILPGHNVIRTVYGMGYSFSAPDTGHFVENENSDSVQL